MLLLLVSSIHSVPLPQKVLISPEDVQDEFRTITMFLSKQFGERNWSLFMSAWVRRASTTVSTNVVSLFFWCFSIFLEVILTIFGLYNARAVSPCGGGTSLAAPVMGFFSMWYPPSNLTPGGGGMTGTATLCRLPCSSVRVRDTSSRYSCSAFRRAWVGLILIIATV